MIGIKSAVKDFPFKEGFVLKISSKLALMTKYEVFDILVRSCTPAMVLILIFNNAFWTRIITPKLYHL
jgi:hypothetical protein